MRNLLAKPRFSPILLAYTRPEFLHWQRLLSWVDQGWEAGQKHEWDALGQVVVRGKEHRFLMNLDRSDWCQRLTYFTGRYYEKHVLSAFNVILRRGDHFVDIGANIGMLTLHARALVGSEGSVDSFEPNPPSAAALHKHLAINNVKNVVVHECALSDARGSLSLKMTSDHSGTATLADVGGSEIASTTVEVRVADQEIVKPPRLIKIDVEGYELHVLHGLQQTLSLHRPYLILELIEGHLQNAGSSVDAVFEFMHRFNYEAWGIGSKRRRMRQRLVMTPLSARMSGAAAFSDVLWLPVGHSLDMTPFLEENL